MGWIPETRDDWEQQFPADSSDRLNDESCQRGPAHYVRNGFELLSIEKQIGLKTLPFFSEVDKNTG